MTFYVERTSKVEAVRFTGDSSNATSVLAWVGGRAKIKHTAGQFELLLGRQSVPSGSWLIRRGKALIVMSDEEFTHLYEEIVGTPSISPPPAPPAPSIQADPNTWREGDVVVEPGKPDDELEILEIDDVAVTIDGPWGTKTFTRSDLKFIRRGE